MKSQDGTDVSPSQFLGNKVVVYFYSRDNTSGCTRQALAFKEVWEEFKKMDARSSASSATAWPRTQRFAEKHGLAFTLLSDPELEAIWAFGVRQEKKLYGKTGMGVVRSSFIIDERGRARTSAGMIVKACETAKPDANAGEILSFLG